MLFNLNVHLAQSLNPKIYTGGIKFIDIATKFEEITDKIKKFNELLNHGNMDEDVTRYVTWNGQDLLSEYGIFYKKISTAS